MDLLEFTVENLQKVYVLDLVCVYSLFYGKIMGNKQLPVVDARNGIPTVAASLSE
jgi:hypothetical protein